MENCDTRIKIWFYTKSYFYYCNHSYKTPEPKLDETNFSK